MEESILKQVSFSVKVPVKDQDEEDCIQSVIADVLGIDSIDVVMEYED